MNSKLYLIFLLLNLIININNIEESDFPNYLRFPFITKTGTSSKSEFDKNFNESIFLDYLMDNPLFISVKLGTPSQISKIMLDFNDMCFSFDNNKKFKDTEYNNIQTDIMINYNKITPYNKKISTSSNKINNEESEDIFYLYNYINEKINKTITLNYKTDNINNEECLYGKIGLNLNNNFKEINCPKFGENLKNKKILSKLIYSFDFYSRFDGYFYIGPEPHFFNIKKSTNKDYQYVKMKTIPSKEGYINWDIKFDKIIIKNDSDYYNDYNLINTQARIDFNLGLIIGTKEYQEFIDKNFFNYMIEKEICKKNLVQYSLSNYYVYNCNVDLYQRIKLGRPTTYFDLFPEIEFYNSDLENNLKISKNYLFENINRKYYFLIIFVADKNNNIWRLGQPFLKYHQFVFDYDSKTVGYYDTNIYKKKENKKNEDESNVINDKEKNETDYSNKNKENKGLNNIVKIIIQIIIIGFIAFLAFYFGMKIKESRKKRANELIDDNYEYLSHNNNINNETNNNNKVNSNIELNKMGI